MGGREPPLAWAARMYEVANRELARGRRAPLVLRGLLDEEARQSLLALFEEEAAAGRLQGDQVHLPPAHPAVGAVRAVAGRAAWDAAFVPAYHELAVVRRYVGPSSGFVRHCDNAVAPNEERCAREFAECMRWLRVPGRCPRLGVLPPAGANASRAWRLALAGQREAMSSARTACSRLPLRCLFSACERRSRAGCGFPRDLPSWPEDVRGRLPQAHAPFRALSLSADLDEDFEGGRLRFYSEDGRESWLASEISLGDGLLFDSGTPHSVDPLARGNRTVLLYWFHAEPWGADPDSPVQQAYREHVEGLTNSDDAGNAELKRRLYRELVRWR
mmetsp:Transcript_57879/g.181777  ORF Transcript_57879/g.181777 Transcript_57879/m.181777 type:complete len:331 (+) Transcript_57879:3-995(+)